MVLKTKNLCMAWVDFKMTYMLLHLCILETLNMCGITENVCALFRNSMPGWKTHCSRNSQLLTKVTFKRSIFQGDSWSPLLFIISLIPLSVVLGKINMHCELIKNRSHVNHLLFIDDLNCLQKHNLKWRGWLRLCKGAARI